LSDDEPEGVIERVQEAAMATVTIDQISNQGSQYQPVGKVLETWSREGNPSPPRSTDELPAVAVITSAARTIPMPIHPVAPMV
jgi:hypothetical protein